VIGPPVIALGLVPVRSSVGLTSALLVTVLVVVVVAAIGGARPAVIAAGVGILADDFFFTVPYDSLSIHLPANRVAVIVFVVVGVVVGIVVGTLIDQLARLANEQAALRRVATLVARATPPEELFAAVTKEAGQLLGVDISIMHRYGSDGTITVVGNWDKTGAHILLGNRYVLGGRNLSTLVAQTGGPARMDSFADSSGPPSTAVRDTGARSGVGTPIMVEGRPWGIMIVASTRERPLSRDTESRLAAFTDLVATSIANAESRAELAASRARVVASADEARRRIERDLHDGAQQRLVSLGLELRTAQTMVPPGLSELSAQLSLAVKGLNDVGEDLQEISRGVHPAILSRGGIGPAIKMLARRSAIPVELDLRANERLPGWLEVAAYYVVSEALTNAAKHSQASVVHVDFVEENAVVKLSIRDDGIGGADPSHGSGLIGLRDRVEAFGGTIDITSAVGAGTCLQVTIPIGGRPEWHPK
jgi:signal transduction histidine kinase